MGEPQASSDGATKNYVDTTVQGLDAKASVKCASTANFNVSTGGLTAQDGITPLAGSRVLLKNQTENLHRYHPKAQMWVSPQGFSQEWLNEFLDYLKREKQDSLDHCTQCGTCVEVCPMPQYDPAIAPST